MTRDYSHSTTYNEEESLDELEPLNPNMFSDMDDDFVEEDEDGFGEEDDDSDEIFEDEDDDSY